MPDPARPPHESGTVAGTAGYRIRVRQPLEVLMRKTLIRGALVLSVCGAAACAPYYMDGDPGHYPAPGYPGPAYPAPGYPGGGYTPGPGAMVDTIGCVRPGVENACVILQGTDGRAWNVTGLQPAPNPEWAIRVTGRVAGNAMGYCQQGPILSDVRWEYTNMRCTGGRVEGWTAYPPPPY
jgi:hypothetical protein